MSSPTTDPARPQRRGRHRGQRRVTRVAGAHLSLVAVVAVSIGSVAGAATRASADHASVPQPPRVVSVWVDADQVPHQVVRGTDGGCTEEALAQGVVIRVSAPTACK